MRAPWRQSAPWLLGWAVLLLAGSLSIVRVDLAQRRSSFALRIEQCALAAVDKLKDLLK